MAKPYNGCMKEKKERKKIGLIFKFLHQTGTITSYIVQVKYQEKKTAVGCKKKLYYKVNLTQKITNLFF